MKKKITLLAAATFLCFSGIRAQSTCIDLNGFVDHKNQGPTGSYPLQLGSEEFGGQTYNYSGSGKISSVRIYGNYPSFYGGVPLRISVYNVDMSGRPTTAIQSVNTIWWTFDNINGYINVNFPGGGVNINHNFAITTQILNAFPYGNTFNLQYTGNGEGMGQDLASLAGTTTGFNWTSAMTNFSKDGDFYLVPKMTHFINSSFQTSSVCNNTGAPVSFTNTTVMTKDSMFNKIGLASYGGSNYYYTWNFGDGSGVSHSVNATHTYTAPGVYTASLTSTIDGWNSLCADTYTTKISVGLAVSATSITNVTCNGNNNGSFVAVGQYGAPTYSYSLNGSTYQGSTMFSGLTAGTKTLYVKDILGCTNTTTLNITEPSAITINSASSTNASCGNSDGSILVNATGGAGSLQYRLNGGSYQSTGLFTSHPIGVYNVTVKDINACTTATTVLINDFGGPTMTYINSTQVSCNGANDGSIAITTSGGTGSILYSINGGLSFQSLSTFLNVDAGTYSIMVKDATNCTDVSTILINQPQPITINLSSMPVTCNGTNTGQINVTSSSGGIGLHSYSLNGINYQSGQNFSGLSVGTHTVYAKDVANCISTKTISITQPSAISASISTSSTTCNGSYNGGMSIITTGGNGNYQYSIDGGSNYQYNSNFEELAAGTYTVLIKDMANCLLSKTATVNQPAVISTTVNTTNSTCGNTNGGILVIANGGSGSFQYSIDGTNFNTTGAFGPMVSGTYYIITKDIVGCSKIVSATIADSNGPSIINSTSTNVSCNAGNNGSINVTNVTGGVGTLEYSINGTNWQTSPIFSNLQSGSYLVTVKDANGCTGTTTISLTQPNPFIINPIILDATCHNGVGTTTITAAGGAGVLAYSINNGLSYQSSNVFNNLNADNYTVLVKDAANCVGSQSFVIDQPSSIRFIYGVLNVTCSGNHTGEITVAATGGTGSFEYSINNGLFSSSHLFTNLAGNTTYVIAAKDANNCIQTQTVYVNEPAPITIIPTESDVTCAGGNNGAINLAITGGVYPYTYNWSNGSNTQGIFNLSVNTYSVVVSDFNGCSSTKTFTITQPSNPLIVNATVTNASNGSTNDGAIDVTVTGGVSPYSYSWSEGATTEDLTNLLPGAYLITITDANGCETSTTILVNNALDIADLQISGNDIVLYPNPAKDIATIKNNGAKIDKIEIVNLLGQKLFGTEPKSLSTDINISNLEPGIYFVKVYINNKYALKRMAVIK